MRFNYSSPSSPKSPPKRAETAAERSSSFSATERASSVSNWKGRETDGWAGEMAIWNSNEEGALVSRRAVAMLRCVAAANANSWVRKWRRRWLTLSRSGSDKKSPRCRCRTTAAAQCDGEDDICLYCRMGCVYTPNF